MKGYLKNQTRHIPQLQSIFQVAFSPSRQPNRLPENHSRPPSLKEHVKTFRRRKRF
ncbi:MULTISPECIES: hypothetical protein [Eikenella]|uniref:hypothetical protein n=1 Tax=Eikenella TaxID=538 RepID=UPI000A3FCB1E|nr:MULTISPECIES: hypothetical protein [Eikenella]